MSNTNNAAPTVTVTRTGRTTVRFADPVTGKAKRRSFRTEREARVFLNGVARLTGYWENSATSSVMSDYASGNFVTITVG